MTEQVEKFYAEMAAVVRVHLKGAKEEGKKVIGLYCAYMPTELVWAAGAIPVGLCATRADPIPRAEEDLPPNLCPMVKSSYGFAVTGTCPFFTFSDCIVGETTCDGKKKMFELLRNLKPMYVMNLPNKPDNARALELWTQEIKNTKTFIEQNVGTKITDKALKAAIKTTNKQRRLMKQVFETARFQPPPLSGLELNTVIFSSLFQVDQGQTISRLEGLLEELKTNAEQGKSPFPPNVKRILMAGCPVGHGSEKVLDLIEDCGAAVVCSEACTGMRSIDTMVDENENKDPIVALAERYLTIPCSCMTPNEGRLEMIGRLIREYKADGVMELVWQACHTYNIEAYEVKQYVTGELGIPYLHIETDYSESDTEQLRTRIEAFLEMVG
ncbi:MAG: double-cubane-cluster-containing anaerobic reductase [Thermodesulfobacteriota bacterium]|nr:double-cubane-cluster-containing anaerobic reductase [Thermodesulfobacteriota bacterium]